MGTKYSSQAASGYNSVPPADDGTVSEANKGKWSTIKTKLADPVKTLADAINTALGTHFDHGPTALTSNTTLGASHYEKFIQVSGSGVTLTLSDAASLPTGWNCEIVNTDSSNSVTLGRATGGDTINGTAADYTLPPLWSVKVFVIAAATGFRLEFASRSGDAIFPGMWTTFTPTVTLVGGAGNTVPVYTTNSGRYARLGNVVVVNILLATDGGAEGAGSGVFNIALPVAASASAVDVFQTIGRGTNGATEFVLLGFITASATTISLRYFDTISTIASFTGANQNNTTRQISISFSYEV